jgi:integrase
VEVASSIKIQPGDDVRLVAILPYTPERVEKIKTISGRRRDAEQRYWTVPATTGVVERLVSLFTGDEVRVDPTLHRDWDTIKRILTAVKNELTLQRYSPKTHDVYLRHLGRFLNHFGRAAETLTSDELGDYFLGLVRSGISHSYQNQAISAVKFLYWHVLRRPEVLVDLPRPVRRKKRLPAMLSRGEVRRLFQAVNNLKHRAVLLVIYPGILRVSEAARLKVSDVDGGSGSGSSCGAARGTRTGTPSSARPKFARTRRAHVAPLLRHPSAGGRRRYTIHPGAAGARGCADYAALYPRQQPGRRADSQPYALWTIRC